MGLVFRRVKLYKLHIFVCYTRDHSIFVRYLELIVDGLAFLDRSLYYVGGDYSTWSVFIVVMLSGLTSGNRGYVSGL